MVKDKGKGKVSHLYSAAGSMRPTYLQNALHYLPSRATPPNLGVKIPGSHQHTHAGWGLTCLPSNAMALPVLIYTWVGWSLVNLKQESAQPKLPQFWLWSVSNPQPLTHEPRTLPLHHWGYLRILHSNSVITFGPYKTFSNKEMEILLDSLSMYLAFLTCIERSDSGMMERSECVLLC